MIDDHGVNPNISHEDQALVRMVMSKFDKYKKARASYDKNFLHYYKMWRGDQWSGVKMPQHRQREVVNMIWSTNYY